MAKEAPTTITATSDDNYQTIAEKLGATDDILAKAQALYDLNNANPIYPGTVVNINANA